MARLLYVSELKRSCADFPVEEIFNAKNRGVGGSTTFDTYERIDDILSRKPSKIFMLEGINDIRDGVPLDSSINEYKKIIRKLKATDYYVISILPTYQKKDYNPQIKKFNDSLKAASRFLDLYNQMADSNFYYDGLHLNAEGYSKLSDLLRPYVQ